MVSKRRILEEGHRRKFLAVIDETPECERAVSYAARRARATGGALILVYVIEPGDFQHWLGVEEIMRAESREAAETALSREASKIRETLGIEAECVIREGTTAEEIHNLIEEDRDIAILVLAAGSGKEGPGPLVSAIAGKASPFPIPVTVVPHDLSDGDIESLT